MTNLENFRYTLASAGYSIEQIEQAEQELLNIVIATGASPEHVAVHLLVAIRAMKPFQEAMQALENAAGQAAQTVARLPQMAGLSDKTTKKTERTPYYQKNRRQWWK